MNLVQRCKTVLKTAMIALAASLVLFAPVAMAAPVSLPIVNGQFGETKVVPQDFGTLTSAVVSFDNTADSADISIAIGEAFSCNVPDAKNGDNLLASCPEHSVVVTKGENFVLHGSVKANGVPVASGKVTVNLS